MANNAVPQCRPPSARYVAARRGEARAREMSARGNLIDFDLAGAIAGAAGAALGAADSAVNAISDLLHGAALGVWHEIKKLIAVEVTLVLDAARASGLLLKVVNQALKPLAKDPSKYLTFPLSGLGSITVHFSHTDGTAPGEGPVLGDIVELKVEKIDIEDESIVKAAKGEDKLKMQLRIFVIFETHEHLSTTVTYRSMCIPPMSSVKASKFKTSLSAVVDVEWQPIGGEAPRKEETRADATDGPGFNDIVLKLRQLHISDVSGDGKPKPTGLPGFFWCMFGCCVLPNGIPPTKVQSGPLVTYEYINLTKEHLGDAMVVIPDPLSWLSPDFANQLPKMPNLPDLPEGVVQ